MDCSRLGRASNGDTRIKSAQMTRFAGKQRKPGLQMISSILGRSAAAIALLSIISCLSINHVSAFDLGE